MANQKHLISVCIISHPDENLDACLESLKQQSYNKKQIIVQKRIGRFSELRNQIIEKAKGDIIAFIDADCKAEKHWLEEINNIFQDSSIIGVFGKVPYELKGKVPSISTRIINNEGQGVLTANAAFKADILKKVKFDESINSGEDKAIHKRLENHGKVIYSDTPIVFHTYQTWNFKSIINHSKKYIDLLKLNEIYSVPISKKGIFVWPEHYLIIIFPPLVLLLNSVRSFYDLKIALGNYIEKLYARLLIWKYAIKNKKLIF